MNVKANECTVSKLFCVSVSQALALGARAVFVGRPVLWGLAHNGEEGVYSVLKLLNDEFVMAMKLAGAVRVEVSLCVKVLCSVCSACSVCCVCSV